VIKDLIQRLRQGRGIGLSAWPLVNDAADALEAQQDAFQTCLDIVAKVKTDPLTQAGESYKIHNSKLTGKDFMVAVLDDVEEMIRKAKNGSAQ
jgi:uncharacterized glyoxalase superfamily protein PhnB